MGGAYQSNGNGTYTLVIVDTHRTPIAKIEAVANETRKHYRVRRLDQLSRQTVRAMRLFVDRRI